MQCFYDNTVSKITFISIIIIIILCAKCQMFHVLRNCFADMFIYICILHTIVSLLNAWLTRSVESKVRHFHLTLTTKTSQHVFLSTKQMLLYIIQICPFSKGITWDSSNDNKMEMMNYYKGSERICDFPRARETNFLNCMNCPLPLYSEGTDSLTNLCAKSWLSLLYSLCQK